MTFKLNKKETAAFNKFVEDNKDKEKGCLVKVTFTLTVIRDGITVKKGKIKKDITDYECW